MAERYCAENMVFHAGQRTLIDDVSLTLSQGELVALIGPNGAGKSTLLRLLTGYLKPASGRCSLAGAPLAAATGQTLPLPGGHAPEYPTRIRLAGRSGDRDGACAVDAPP